MGGWSWGSCVHTLPLPLSLFRLSLHVSRPAATRSLIVPALHFPPSRTHGRINGLKPSGQASASPSTTRIMSAIAQETRAAAGRVVRAFARRSCKCCSDKSRLVMPARPPVLRSLGRRNAATITTASVAPWKFGRLTRIFVDMPAPDSICTLILPTLLIQYAAYKNTKTEKKPIQHNVKR